MTDDRSVRISLPELPCSGGCQCGGVRYRLTGRPLMFLVCHCRECQRQSASAFGESLSVRRSDLEIDGELRLTTRVADSGNTREGWFCPGCGVRIFHCAPGAERVNLRAGTLDDPSWLVPAGHIWTDSKQPWVALDPGAIAYGREAPPADDALERRWASMLAPM